MIEDAKNNGNSKDPEYAAFCEEKSNTQKMSSILK
jgi:hypothetical protein